MVQKTRTQKLRAKRHSRSAAREAKQFDAVFSKQLDAFAVGKDIVGGPRLSRKWLESMDDTGRFHARQQVRDKQHIKRNKRKVNHLQKGIIKRRVLNPQECEQRNVLLKLNERPKEMPQDLYKGLLRERKELVNEHPKAERRAFREINRGSEKQRFANQAKPRVQLVPELGKKLTSKEIAEHVQANKPMYGRREYYKNGKVKGDSMYEVLGYKTIHHAVPVRVQRFG